MESMSLAVDGKATGNKMSADSQLSFALPSSAPSQPRSGGGTESAKLTAQALSLIPPGSWGQALPRVLPSFYLFLRSAMRSAGECYVLPQEKSFSLLALPVRRGEPEQQELSIPIFLCHSAYFLIPKMKLQLHWMDVLKCKPPEMGKCWLVNCLLSPCSDAILYTLNFSALFFSKGESATCSLLVFCTSCPWWMIPHMFL